MVDEITDKLGVVATVFVREGNDFRRITTSIKTADGNRAVGTMPVSYTHLNSGFHHQDEEQR